MNTFEVLVDKAVEQLREQRNNNADTPMFRGIGYALLALAVAIKEKNENGNNS
jgi:hypothetical protein